VATNIISISAAGTTAAQAERTADAIANSYVAYINAPGRPGPRVQARILTSAVGATTKPLPARLLALSGPGALYGALIGAVGALAFIGVPRFGIIHQRTRRASVLQAAKSSPIADDEENTDPLDHPVHPRLGEAGRPGWCRSGRRRCRTDELAHSLKPGQDDPAPAGPDGV
jgi:hypothetical protein